MEQQWVSQRQAARQLGYRSHRAVQKAIESGRIPETAVQRSPEGMVTAVDVVAAKAALAVNTDPVSKADGTGNLGASGGTRGGNALLSARTREKLFAANLRELEYFKAAGDLIWAAPTEKEARETARSFRNAMLAIADRAAPVLASMSSPIQVHKFLTEQIQGALRDYGVRLGEPETAAAGAEGRETALP